MAKQLLESAAGEVDLVSIFLGICYLLCVVLGDVYFVVFKEIFLGRSLICIITSSLHTTTLLMIFSVRLHVGCSLMLFEYPVLWLIDLLMVFL